MKHRPQCRGQVGRTTRELSVGDPANNNSSTATLSSTVRHGNLAVAGRSAFAGAALHPATQSTTTTTNPALLRAVNQPAIALDCGDTLDFVASLPPPHTRSGSHSRPDLGWSTSQVGHRISKGQTRETCGGRMHTYMKYKTTHEARSPKLSYL